MDCSQVFTLLELKSRIFFVRRRFAYVFVIVAVDKGLIP